MTTVLAGDIGGTKTLLALYAFEGADSPLSLLRSQQFRSLDWPELVPMAQEFLAGETAEAACFAVAGPVNNGKAQLTNLPWDLDQLRLGRRLGVDQVELVNDFGVLIYGLGHLQPSQVAVVKPGVAEPEDTLLVIGAGTGLGVAYGVPTPGGLVAVASEGAHGEFASRNQREWDLRQWVASDLNLSRVSIERIVSGTGLGHVARWLLASETPGSHPLHAISERWLNPSPGDGEADLPAAVARLASEADPLATQALELWIDLYGSVCGDLALAALCRGGIWLAGGTAAKLLPHLQAGHFSRAFLHKGRLGAVLTDVPITAITDPAIGLYSAACRARMLIA